MYYSEATILNGEIPRCFFLASDQESLHRFRYAPVETVTGDLAVAVIGDKQGGLDGSRVSTVDLHLLPGGAHGARLTPKKVASHEAPCGTTIGLLSFDVPYSSIVGGSGRTRARGKAASGSRAAAPESVLSEPAAEYVEIARALRETSLCMRALGVTLMNVLPYLRRISGLSWRKYLRLRRELSGIVETVIEDQAMTIDRIATQFLEGLDPGSHSPAALDLDLLGSAISCERAFRLLSDHLPEGLECDQLDALRRLEGALYATYNSVVLNALSLSRGGRAEAAAAA